MQYVERVQRCQPGWRQKVDKYLSLLLPGHCVLCGLDAPPSAICQGCRSGLPHCSGGCAVCGLPIETTGSHACGACQQSPPPWSAVWAAAWYDFPVDRLVQQFKFRRKLVVGKVLAGLLRDRLLSQRCPRPDLVAPVPLHAWRQHRRGFNQAFDMASHVCRDLGLPSPALALRRKRPTPQQSGLNARQRRVNLRGAFSWNGPGLAGKRVALVDDVMTTGSTAAECARVLKRAGAGPVDVWVAARAR